MSRARFLTIVLVAGAVAFLLIVATACHQPVQPQLGVPWTCEPVGPDEGVCGPVIP